MSLIKSIKKVFDWKYNPGGVFWIATPLLVLGFGFHILYAYLMYERDGTLVYFWIVLGGIGLLALGLWPVRKRLWKHLTK